MRTRKSLPPLAVQMESKPTAIEIAITRDRRLDPGFRKLLRSLDLRVQG
jgi:hypothetical protein